MKIPFPKLWKKDKPSVRIAKWVRLWILLTAVGTVVGFSGYLLHLQSKLDGYTKERAEVIGSDVREVTVTNNRGVRETSRLYYLLVRLERNDVPLRVQHLNVSHSTYRPFKNASDSNPRLCMILVNPTDMKEWEFEGEVYREQFACLIVGGLILAMIGMLFLFFDYQVRTMSRGPARIERPPVRRPGFGNADSPYGSESPGLRELPQLEHQASTQRKP